MRRARILFFERMWILAFIGGLWHFGADAGELKIIHINIGQGDATLILGPADDAGDRVSVLMDAGDIPHGGIEKWTKLPLLNEGNIPRPDGDLRITPKL